MLQALRSSQNWNLRLPQNNMRSNTLLSVIFFVGMAIISMNAEAQTRIRLALGGANYNATGTDLTVSSTVECTTPSVISGTAADQMFRDDAIGAAYFGYYLTLGVRTTLQIFGTNVNVKVRRGASSTANRSYYLLGNGTTTPDDQSDLTIAPAAYTTFVSAPKNDTACGTNWSANGLPANGVNGCNGQTIINNMDVTQFVKVLFTDPPGTAIISELDFIAAVE